jgi:predicted transcriptional regulator of viral defense system
MAQTLSSTDSRILEELTDRGRVYLDLDTDRAWLNDISTDPQRQLIRMKERGVLFPVAAGRYLVRGLGEAEGIDEVPLGLLVAAAFAGRENYYLGYLSALIEHRLVDEHSRDVYLAVFGTAPRLKTLAGRAVHITTLKSGKKQFGQERARALGRTFYFRSDLERTLLDTLDRPALCHAPETWVRAWARAFASKELDRSRLVDYALQIGGSLAARCAFWMRELGDVRNARLILRSIHAPLTGPRALNSAYPFVGKNWPRDRETGLIINMPAHAIEGWLTYGK